MRQNTFYRMFSKKAGSGRSMIYHGHHLGFDYRVIGICAPQGWAMRIHVLEQGVRIDECAPPGYYDDFAQLRIAGLLLAQQRIDTMAWQRSADGAES